MHHTTFCQEQIPNFPKLHKKHSGTIVQLPRISSHVRNSVYLRFCLNSRDCQWTVPVAVLIELIPICDVWIGCHQTKQYFIMTHIFTVI